MSDVNNRRLEHWRAQQFGDEVDVFVKAQTGNWFDPVVSTSEVAAEFDMAEEEVFERLQQSEQVVGKEIEPGIHVWW